jgi:hypothetical protein
MIGTIGATIEHIEHIEHIEPGGFTAISRWLSVATPPETYIKGNPMKSNASQIAVMNLEEGEDILTGRVTPHIPQIGIYKLLAKRKVDGTIEWAHFVQRDNGVKEKVMRGTVKTIEEFDLVNDAINNTLQKIFGVAMQAAEYDVRTTDGKKVSETIH